MPVYRIQDPLSGKTVTMEGDRMPTRDEIDSVFETLRQSGQLPTKDQFLRDPNRKPASAEQFTPPQKASSLNALLDLLPMAGGAIGGFVGSVPGAVAGGAAGEGFKQLAQHATELPGAIKDVASNLLEHPIATAEGIVSGTNRGGVNAATQGAVQGGMEAGGQLAGKYVIQPAARAVMRGYLKPSLAAANINDARQIVQTALDEALPVTKGGEARGERLIGELNNQINAALDSVQGKVDLKKIADQVRAYAKRTYFKPGIDSADYKAALEVADSIDRHASMAVTKEVPVTRTVPSQILDASGKPMTTEVAGTEKVTTYPTDVSARRANVLKQDVRPPSRAFGQQSYNAETDTRKVAGSITRQSIENTAKREGVDTIGAMNEREGRLIDAVDAVKRAAGREENKGLNPTAIPNLIAGSVGLEEGYRKDPAAGLAWMLATRAALSPAVASRAAIKAYQLARSGYSVSSAARAAVAAVQASGADDTSDGQIEPGNIDLSRRPRVRNADGSVSTVRSISINEDGKEILIPTVTDDGRVVSNEDAIAMYHRTGRHLGVFDSPAAATAYAKRLHEQQAAAIGAR